MIALIAAKTGCGWPNIRCARNHDNPAANADARASRQAPDHRWPIFSKSPLMAIYFSGLQAATRKAIRTALGAPRHGDGYQRAANELPKSRRAHQLGLN